MTVRVAVIGAGPSGLAQLRAFQSAGEGGAAIPEVTCFEKQANWGGLWNYSWRTGLDEFGEPAHGSMYRYLWSNGPKECLEFADYSFEQHFGRPIPSYPPRAVLHDYIMGRVEKSDARAHTRFCHCVRWVEYDPGRGTFAVTVKNLRDDRLETAEFSHVVVASGHFSTPNVPHFAGIERFPGRVLHAHDFRDANEFVGKDLLVVGSSYSAEDIASQCYKYGAKSITFSFRREGALDFAWPETFAKKPLLKELVGKRAVFEDGSAREVDAIILCTGYLHHFPFMADDLRLRTGNRLWPLDLWQGVVWEKNPRLFYLGMQDQYYTFNMFDAQAWFARDVIIGRIRVPDAATMRAEGAAWRAREEGLADAFEGIDFQRDYVKALVAATDYPGFDVDRVAELFKAWEHHKVESIMGYRDRAYASVLTGNMAPVHHTPWLAALDDSLESFLQVPRAAE